MGCVGFSHPMCGLWNGSVFLLGLFFCLCWDGASGFFVPPYTWRYVGWGGMRMGKHVGLLFFFGGCGRACRLGAGLLCARLLGLGMENTCFLCEIR